MPLGANTGNWAQCVWATTVGFETDYGEDKRDLTAKSVVKDITYAFVSQVISLVFSATVTLIVPKVLGLEQFAYWQLFLFYTTYVGVFHLGLNDGVYLRLGGENYAQINASLLGTQLKLSALFQIALAALIAVGAYLLVEDQNRRFVIYAAAIYLVVSNFTMFLGYLFQAVNQTRVFSTAVIIDRSFSLTAVTLAIGLHLENYTLLVVFYSLGKVCAMVYCAIRGRRVVTAAWYSTRRSVREMGFNIAAGSQLMIGSAAGLMILGFGQVVIDHRWGVGTFGVVAMSLLLTNLVLVFVAQIGMVLFPLLRRAAPARLEGIFSLTRNSLMLALPGVFLLYFPLRFVLGLWLPQYIESLRYLALLLPICVFDGQMQLLYNTYFKVLRKERFLLIVNVGAMLLSVVLCSASAFVLGDVRLVVLSMVISSVARSVVCDRVLQNRMHGVGSMSIWLQVVCVAVLSFVAWYLAAGPGLISTLAGYGFYLSYNHRTLSAVVEAARSRIRSSRQGG